MFTMAQPEPTSTSGQLARVVPPNYPGNFLSLACRAVTDTLSCIPEAAYRQPLTRLLEWPPIVVVADPNLVREVLSDRASDFPKPDLTRRTLEPLAGDGVLLADGGAWRCQRKVLAPLFRRDNLLTHVPAMAARGERLIDKWRKEALHRTPRDIAPDMTSVTFDIIANTLLSGGGGHVGEIIEHRQADYFKGVPWALLYYLCGIPDWFPRPGKQAMWSCERELRAEVDRIVAHRQHFQRPNSDLLGQLLAANDPAARLRLTDRQVVDNLLTILLAGHETTASALTWSLYVLSRKPEWARRIANEVHRVVGDGPIEPGHVDRLTITRSVFLEVLRLYPPLPEFSRSARTTCRVGGLTLRKGTLLNIVPYVIHRHENLWTAPNAFRPERFATSSKTERRPGFMPFGVGPRTCIGMTFAMIEGVVLLATFARSASFYPAPEADEPRPVVRLSLKPMNGMPLVIRLNDPPISASAPS